MISRIIYALRLRILVKEVVLLIVFPIDISFATELYPSSSTSQKRAMQIYLMDMEPERHIIPALCLSVWIPQGQALCRWYTSVSMYKGVSVGLHEEVDKMQVIDVKYGWIYVSSS